MWVNTSAWLFFEGFWKLFFAASELPKKKIMHFTHVHSWWHWFPHKKNWCDPSKKMAKDLQTIEPVAAFNMIKSSPTTNLERPESESYPSLKTPLLSHQNFLIIRPHWEPKIPKSMWWKVVKQLHTRIHECKYIYIHIFYIYIYIYM